MSRKRPIFDHRAMSVYPQIAAEMAAAESFIHREVGLGSYRTIRKGGENGKVDVEVAAR
jgi:hypothetical protein